jgi:Mannosyl-glycoprotein endo-beta-N-acetylglucosaminidase
MQLRRALVAGGLVTAVLVPAHAGFAQESPSTSTTSTTTTSTTSTTTTTTTTTPPPAPTSSSTPAPATPTPKPDPDAFAALANRVSQNQAMLAELSAQVDQATQKLAGLSAEIDTTQQKLDATRAEAARLLQLVRDRAAYIYQHADVPNTAVVDIEHVIDITAGKKYAESATQTDGTKVSDLARVSAQLDEHRKELESARAGQQQERDRLDEAQAALEALTAHQKKLLDQAGAVPVMGDAQLTAAEITGWFDARGVKYRLSGGIPIGDLVQLYMEEGKAEHVRPELAFAQSIIETGSFGNALDNNYSGIGACDSCHGEPAFPTPRDGVRGQMQLLRNYADPASRAANLANLPSPTIYGSEPARAAQLYDTFFAKGRTPTWNVMGNGNWATDPGYAQKVLTVYFQMVSFAARHRSG